MLEPNIQNFLGCDSDYGSADIVLFGAPFDSTTSYRPGTRFGPSEIRAQSYGVETYSPYQSRELSEKRVFDSGDLELRFGDPQNALEAIEGRTETILSDGKLPFMLGGEHLVTLGAVRAVKKRFPDLKIVHLDAHTDMRDDYLGARLSHATVMRRCLELVGDKNVWQFGIRSGEKTEFELCAGRCHFFPRLFAPDPRRLSHAFAYMIDQLDGAPVYFTLDLDVLDPSEFGGTGTQEAGGMSFPELLTLIKMLGRLNVAGLDMVELSPTYDQNGASAAMSCKLVRELLCALRG